MKITIGQLLNSVPGLKKLVDKPLPAKTAYRLKRIMDAVTSEASHIEKIRVDMIMKYADEQTEEEKKAQAPIKVTTKLNEFQTAFLPLLEEEIEVNAYKLEFNDIEKLDLTVNDLSSIEPWFNIPEELLEPVTIEKTEKITGEEVVKNEEVITPTEDAGDVVPNPVDPVKD